MKSLGSTLIQLLSGRSLGLELTALTADVIAADARFNLWLAMEGKRRLERDALLQVIDMYEDLSIKSCEEVESLLRTQDSSSIEATLLEALATLEGAMKSEHP
jgi:hypothetical protein